LDEIDPGNVDKGAAFPVCVSGDQSSPEKYHKINVFNMGALYAKIHASLVREHLIAVVWVGEIFVITIARYAQRGLAGDIANSGVVAQYLLDGEPNHAPLAIARHQRHFCWDALLPGAES
jgi:hypothetical protein